MELKIDIITNDECQVVLQDLKEDYLVESSSVTVKDKWKYSETASISVLQYNKSVDPSILTPIFTDHSTSDSITLPVTSDGWFIINYLVLPTKEWFDIEYAKESGSALNLYDTVYYIDESAIYKYFNGVITSVDIEEVVLRNIEGTTISKSCEDYVSVCFLNKCYISLCQQIFLSAGFNECNKRNTIDSDLIYRRDLVWMTINVVKYMVELNQLAEAQRIIERTSGCNGLCKNEFKQYVEHDCKCGGR